MGVRIVQWITSFILATLLLSHTTESLPDVISIGGLFDIGDVKQEVAFRYAVNRINSVRSTFRRTSRSRLEPMIEKIPPFDSFHASKRVCHLLRSGVAAIFGPQSGQTSSHVQSICDAMEVPHVETRWDYRLRRDDYSVNLYPHPSSLSKAYLDLVRLFQWKSFCILYENNEGLVRLQELLKTPSPSEFKKTIRQLPQGKDFRSVLRNIKIEGETNIILDCKTEKIGQVLKQAQQIGMMTPYNNYIVTSLDLHLIDLEDFKYGGSNITALRLIDPDDPNVKHIMEEIRASIEVFTSSFHQEELTLGTETALMYDAVHLFVGAIQALDNSTDVQINPLVCDGEDAWLHGNSLINYMKLVNMTGLTGVVEFDALGFRTDFELDIIELAIPGFVKVGTWSRRLGTNYTRTLQDLNNKTMEGLKNQTLIVSFAFNDPYIMLKESAKSLTGNERYEGFCIDLLHEISKILGFTYVLKHVPGNSYGNINQETNEWNGMIRELLEQRADMAITDLTISYDRETAVDFTMPFMNMGVTIIYKKPRKMSPSLFSFMSPLSLEVWAYMVTAYLGVSALMYILARFTPYEWQNPHPCDPDPDTLENQFTISNCLWFAIGSLMQQGCDFLPQAMSTRMVAGMWWFFTLIMISSYTANLAAFLTVERMESPIESVEDLARQTKIKYGSMVSGTTTSFFRDSTLPIYKKMWTFMESTTPSVFVNSNAEGYARVQESNGLYAFMSESSSIEYVIERRCDLTQVGGLLDSKSYGIALPPGSPYTNAISSAILALHEKSVIHQLKIKWWRKMRIPKQKCLKVFHLGSPYKDAFDVTILGLQERGRLYILKEKWWKQKRGGGRCKEEGGSSIASALNLTNVGGVFVVLIGGMGLALLVAIFEFVVECRNIAKEDEIPLLEVLTKELTFVLHCKGSVKPIKKKLEAEEEEEVDDEEEAEPDFYATQPYNFTAKGPLT